MSVRSGAGVPVVKGRWAAQERSPRGPHPAKMGNSAPSGREHERMDGLRRQRTRLRGLWGQRTRLGRLWGLQDSTMRNGSWTRAQHTTFTGANREPLCHGSG